MFCVWVVVFMVGIILKIVVFGKYVLRCYVVVFNVSGGLFGYCGLLVGR